MNTAFTVLRPAVLICALPLSGTSGAKQKGRIMNTKKARRIIIIGVACFFICAACALGVIRWDIQSDLDKWCSIAQSKHPHPGDGIAAMIEYVQSNSHSLKNRNHVVWALGQARSSRALPILEGYYTGAECDHSQFLCQYELDKAIELCRGKTPNILFIKTP